MDKAVLLIGGRGSKTTEWIPVDGSAARQGPFTVRHGSRHCTIQISDDIIVVTGGWDTFNSATHYHVTDGSETHLTPLLGEGRCSHACGVYKDTNRQQVSKKI